MVLFWVVVAVLAVLGLVLVARERLSPRLALGLLLTLGPPLALTGCAGSYTGGYKRPEGGAITLTVDVPDGTDADAQAEAAAITSAAGLKPAGERSP